MCYTGECLMEDVVGECTLTEHEQDMLKKEFNFNTLCPEPMNAEEQRQHEEALRFIREHRSKQGLRF